MNDKATLIALSALALINFARAAEPLKPASPELALLAPIAGSWEGDYTIGTSPKAKSTSKNKWILDGRFLQSRVHSTDAEGKKFTAVILWGYDVGKKEYTRSFFFSSGASMHERGEYNSAEREFTFREVDPATGGSRVATAKLTDDDTIAWTITLRNKPGENPLLVTGTNHRVKKD